MEIFTQLLAVLNQYGPAAYAAAVKVWDGIQNGKQPNINDCMAIHDNAIKGDYNSDYDAAKQRADSNTKQASVNPAPAK